MRTSPALGCLLALALGAFSLACATATGPDAEASPTDQALSEDERVVGHLFEKPVASLAAKDTGVDSWQVLTVHNSTENADYAVAVGSLAGEPVVEAITKTSNGKREFFLRSPDPKKTLALSISRTKALGYDLEEVAKKAKTVSNPQSRSLCIAETVASGLLGLATAVSGIATVLTCGPGELVSFGAATPVCLGLVGLTYSAGGASLLTGGVAAKCWESRESVK